MNKLEQIVQLLEQSGPVTSARLQQSLDLSQATISRLLGRAESRIIRIGRARASHYALTRNIFEVGTSIPIFEIDEKGRAVHLADIKGVAPDQYYIDSTDTHFWLQGEQGKGLYGGLPYFLDDMRPQGFLGRQIARRYSRQTGYPEDPRQWSESQIGRYLLQEGYDLPGNLILGEQALHSFQNQPVVSVKNRADEYPEMAEAILIEGRPGSSAGGEHQKFTCYVENKGHAIVKFSPAGESIDARRWKDLLISEHCALEALRRAGQLTVNSTIHEYNDRIYLEVERFDRLEKNGRKPMLSLSAIDAEFTGTGQGWSQVSQALYRLHLISDQDLKTIITMELFGHWIGNTDMHLGNLSFTVDKGIFKLLPVYDMLPMMYAPERGEIIPRQLNIPVQPMRHQDAWQLTGQQALSYWETLVEEKKISNDFRQIAANNAQLLSKYLAE